ncbi:hypothetical protein [Actinomadura sp. WMMB 499]|uniref:hypothetical protein n=1 Tax=Actinomadura sp. WMMB 499 TaxID=1219491 RepID=UPI00124806A8|nr:hypothetical protein [Actinomadura sp. WMMB 499]QFG23424.1 hypothetical protein F7P10_22195 [Actinomadura sp. WMMB 499]
MDELRMIKDAYGSPAPPATRETADARARMFGDERVPRARRVGVRFGRPVKAGLGLVAAGAAAAVAIAVAGTGAGTPPPGGSRAGGQVDLGKRAVLAAAENAAKQKSGKYWFSDEISGQSYMIRAETGSYAIVGAHFEYFRWAGAEPGMGEASYGRDIPSRLPTPADEAAWKKAGSPSRFRVWSNDHHYTYDLSKTAWQADDPDPEGGGRWLGGRTIEEVQNLPADPAALGEMFFGQNWTGPLGAPQKEQDPAARKAMERKRPALDRPRHKILRAGRLLQEVPLPPDVRAGLMLALAEQPGIAAIGTAVDPLGREGTALASSSTARTVTGEYGAPKAEQGRYGSREEIIFDRGTGAVLAVQKVLTEPGGPYRDREPGFVIDYSVVRDMGWTDSRPKPRVELPF